MDQKNSKRLTRFELPRYKRGQQVKTNDGEGVIVAIRKIDPSGYWYCINDKYYAQHEIK